MHCDQGCPEPQRDEGAQGRRPGEPREEAAFELCVQVIRNISGRQRRRGEFLGEEMPSAQPWRCASQQLAKEQRVSGCELKQV